MLATALVMFLLPTAIDDSMTITPPPHRLLLYSRIEERGINERHGTIPESG